MAILRFLDDAGYLQTLALGGDPVVLGRSTACQLTFVDDTVSREHVQFERQEDGRYRVRDLGSRNKTHVNGELITETLLAGGDVIRAGGRILEFLDFGAAPASAEPGFLTPDRSDPPHADWIKIKAPLSLTTRQIEQLALLSTEQPLTARIEDIAQSALGKAIVDLQAERGFVALRGDKKTDLRVVAQRGLQRGTGESLIPVSQSFVFAPMLQHVAGRYPETAGQLDSKLGYAAAAIAAPLTYHGEIIGVLYLDRPNFKKAFPSAAVPYLAAAGAQIGTLLGESSRQLTHLSASESAVWMASIRRVQAALRVEAVGNDAFGVATVCHAGRSRCGDFADVLHLDEQRVGVLVVDGGGHGVTGVAQAHGIRAAVRAALAVSEDALMDPAAMFSAINEMVATSPSRQILPCLYVGIDMAAGKLVYINAGGMPPLLMVAPGRLVTLDHPALVLGVDPEFMYDVTRVDVPESFRLVCHTDGVVEANGGSGEVFGEQRLHDVLLDREAFVAPDNLLARINAKWDEHLGGGRGDDDALLLVLSRK